MVLAVACENGERPVLISHESDRFSFTRFLDSVGAFPYEVGDKKRLRVTQGFARLSPGMSMDDIGKLLGEPDAEMLHFRPTNTGNKLAYTTWAYYLRRHERRKVNAEFDQAIFVHFKPEGGMYWADPGSVPGLKPIGSPDLYPAGAA